MWDGDHDVLAPSKSSHETAEAAIQKSRADVRQIVQDLRSSRVSAGSGGAGRGLRGTGLRGLSASTATTS